MASHRCRAGAASGMAIVLAVLFASTGRATTETTARELVAKPVSVSPPPCRPTMASQVAYRFAPAFVQMTGKRTGGGKEYEDYFVRHDFDGDANGFDNWRNLGQALPARNLQAAVYAAVRETDRNYYLHYAYFHPRDPKWFFGHENDLEGGMVVVRKRPGNALPDGTDIVLVQGQAHNRWHYGVAGDMCTVATNQPLSSASCFALDASRTHVVLVSQVGYKWLLVGSGHGTEIPGKLDFGKRYIAYVPWTRAGGIPGRSADGEIPTPGKDQQQVGYALIPLSGDIDANSALDSCGAFGDAPSAGFWDRRRDVRIYGKTDRLGHGLQGKGCKANEPWRWDGFGQPGDFFLAPTRDPAWSELQTQAERNPGNPIPFDALNAPLVSDPYGKDTDLLLFSQLPQPHECNCARMWSAFQAGSSSTDSLNAGPPCADRHDPAKQVTPERTEWKCEQLLDWVPDEAKEIVRIVSPTSYEECALAVPPGVVLRWPGESDPEDAPEPLPSRNKERRSVAQLELRARSSEPGFRLGGLFLQEGVAYDESLGDVPAFLPVPLTAEWKEVLLNPAASPYFQKGREPVAFLIAPDASTALAPANSGHFPERAWDVKSIRLSGAEPDLRERTTPAQLLGISTSAEGGHAPYGSTIHITGRHFAAPCSFNRVTLGDIPQRVVECTPDALTVQVRGSGALNLRIRTAAGEGSPRAGLKTEVFIDPAVPGKRQ